MTNTLTPEAIQQDLRQRLSGVNITVDGRALVVAASDLVRVCQCLKEQEPYRCDLLSNLCAVDFLDETPHLETVYHLYSIEKGHGPIELKVRVPRDDPVQPSVVSIWRSAEYQEREAYDLYGIRYEGHPDLRRILMWDEFEGHPMRKDYVQEDQDTLESVQRTASARGGSASS